MKYLNFILLQLFVCISINAMNRQTPSASQNVARHAAPRQHLRKLKEQIRAKSQQSVNNLKRLANPSRNTSQPGLKQTSRKVQLLFQTAETSAASKSTEPQHNTQNTNIPSLPAVKNAEPKVPGAGPVTLNTGRKPTQRDQAIRYPNAGQLPLNEEAFDEAEYDRNMRKFEQMRIERQRRLEAAELNQNSRVQSEKEKEQAYLAAKAIFAKKTIQSPSETPSLTAAPILAANPLKKPLPDKSTDEKNNAAKPENFVMVRGVKVIIPLLKLKPLTIASKKKN